jgi:bacteriocin-like protein
VITHTSLITALHNNGFTGIDQPNIYSRGLKMTKQKQMTEKELDQVSGGPHIRNFNGRTGVMLCGGTCPDAIRSKQDSMITKFGQGTGVILDDLHC